jgi:hypothetical protein
MSRQSVLSNKELVELSQYTVEKLALRFAGMSHQAAMEFRKQVQIGMTRYRESRNYSPVVLENLLGVTAKIEKWCRQAFLRSKLPKYKIQTQRERDSAVLEWEKYCKKNSY